MSGKKSIIEAILFACGEPVDENRLSQSATVDINELPNIINDLNTEYSEKDSSLQILRLGKSYQITVKKEFAPYIRSAMEAKKDAPLSNASMEVLTIIAYNQPVSKSFVSHVRGVESSNIINALVERELLEEAGRLDVPGKPIAYKTTDVFLRCFGMESLDDLVPIPEKIDIGDSKGN
jgi:segregation and condensation protein B